MSMSKLVPLLLFCLSASNVVHALPVVYHRSPPASIADAPDGLQRGPVAVVQRATTNPVFNSNSGSNAKRTPADFGFGPNPNSADVSTDKNLEFIRRAPSPNPNPNPNSADFAGTTDKDFAFFLRRRFGRMSRRDPNSADFAGTDKDFAFFRRTPDDDEEVTEAAPPTQIVGEGELDPFSNTT